MNHALKTVIYVILAIVACLMVIKVINGLLGLLVPILIIGGGIYIAYKVFGQKSIGSGRGGILP
jgi:hypothetical protein